MLPPDELNELAESIGKNGQREEIITLEGKILDGRNRYEACRIAGVQPKVRPFDPKKDGASPFEFVMDLNWSRRHLTVGQRAAVAAASSKYEAQILNFEEAKEKQGKKQAEKGAKKPTETQGQKPKPKKTITERANKANVSSRSVATATKIEKEAPDLFKKVQSGEMNLNAANEENERRKNALERKEILKRVISVCGKTFGEALDKNTILKTAKELSDFTKLTDEQMKEVSPMVAKGWKVSRALAMIENKIGAESTVAEVINKAIASESQEFAVEVNGWEISAMKVG